MDATKDFEAGELEIEEDDFRSRQGAVGGLRATPVRQIECLDAVTHFDDPVCDVVVAQSAKSESFVVGTIFDKKNRFLIQPNSPRGDEAAVTVKKKAPV